MINVKNIIFFKKGRCGNMVLFKSENVMLLQKMEKLYIYNLILSTKA